MCFVKFIFFRLTDFFFFLMNGRLRLCLFGFSSFFMNGRLVGVMACNFGHVFSQFSFFMNEKLVVSLLVASVTCFSFL